MELSLGGNVAGMAIFNLVLHRQPWWFLVGLNSNKYNGFHGESVSL